MLTLQNKAKRRTMPKWLGVTPNVLEKRIRLGEIEIPRKKDGSPKYTFNHLKYPKDSPWNLPDPKESLWIIPPIDDELFKIAHYMDRNKSYRTTYGKMNEWMKASGGQDMRSGVPVTRSDGNWRQALKESDTCRQGGGKDNFNVRFRESYADLTQQIAYRFPNPGLPRLRQGRIGGSWRHIKEVLGHGGSRVCYVDGLVAVYDEENFNQNLQAQSPYRPHLRRQLYSPNRGYDEDAARKGREGVSLPAVEELPMMSSNERARKMAIQSSNKSKGVYSYNRAPLT